MSTEKERPSHVHVGCYGRTGLSLRAHTHGELEYDCSLCEAGDEYGCPVNARDARDCQWRHQQAAARKLPAAACVPHRVAATIERTIVVHNSTRAHAGPATGSGRAGGEGSPPEA